MRLVAFRRERLGPGARRERQLIAATATRGRDEVTPSGTVTVSTTNDLVDGDTSSIATFPAHLIAQPDGKFIVYNVNGMTRLNADGTIDASFGRLLTDATDLFNLRGAALTASGDLLAAVSRESGFTQDGFIGLTRLQGGGSTPGPIALVGSTLTITGTDDADEFSVGANFPNGDDIRVHHEHWIDRLFDPAACARVPRQSWQVRATTSSSSS